MENGNVVNAVNFPNCDMGICTKDARITIYHRNIANMITSFTAHLGSAGINISDMNSKSKGEYAYTIIDIDGELPEDVVNKLQETEGVIRIRVIK